MSPCLQSERCLLTLIETQILSRWRRKSGSKEAQPFPSLHHRSHTDRWTELPGGGGCRRKHLFLDSQRFNCLRGTDAVLKCALNTPVKYKSLICKETQYTCMTYGKAEIYTQT